MAHLLAARANDELQRYIPERDWDRDRLDEVLGDKPVDSSSQVYSEDMEEWLRTSMPTLTGPHADRPWVKHVLREVSKVAPKFGVA